VKKLKKDFRKNLPECIQNSQIPEFLLFTFKKNGVKLIRHIIRRINSKRKRKCDLWKVGLVRHEGVCSGKKN
jgi:hypothetical protein